MEKSDVMQAAGEASIAPTTYNEAEPYGEPFACVNSNPGNYFMYDDLTTPVRDAAYSGSVEKVGAVIAALGEMEIRTTDDINGEWILNNPEKKADLIHGTHEMLWERWGKGGVAEGTAAAAVGLLPEEMAEVIVEEKFGCTMAKADRKHGIDFVDPSGETHQVKNTKKKPKPSDAKDADHLWWMNSEGEIERITEE